MSKINYAEKMNKQKKDKAKKEIQKSKVSPNEESEKNSTAKISKTRQVENIWFQKDVKQIGIFFIFAILTIFFIYFLNEKYEFLKNFSDKVLDFIN